MGLSRFRDPEDSLVDDIATEKLSLNMMQMAIREYVRRRKDLPEGSGGGEGRRSDVLL